jgi:SAM-dependent methyltransferase
VSPQGAELAHATRQELRDVILRGLDRDYISESCQDAIETGNHYQSVTLGDEQTQGFRTPRYDIFDEIDFEGRSVLDLGSNLGEMSRAARKRGAALVDGFEYDSYFVEMANLINAYNGTTRVSFFQRDITRREIYVDQYDIVMAWAVFIYIGPLMDAVASIARQGFVMETHRIDNDLDSTYLSAILPHFPSYTKLRDTDWGVPHEGEPWRRSVFAFARDDETLHGIVRR